MLSGIRYLFAVPLLLFPALVFAIHHCPDIQGISRIPGEYGWESKDGRWEGYFASPRTGRGDSDHLIGFQQARWIRLTDLLDSMGIVECDYLGNSGNEVIRFITNLSAAARKPTAQNWSCAFNADTPGVECSCAASPADCILPLP